MYIVLEVAFICAIACFIYNIVCYKKKKINYMIKANAFTVKNEEYYKMQLRFGIADSILMVLSVLITIKKDYHLQIIFSLLTYTIVNFVLRYAAIIKKYASFEENIRER